MSELTIEGLDRIMSDVNLHPLPLLSEDTIKQFCDIYWRNEPYYPPTPIETLKVESRIHYHLRKLGENLKTLPGRIRWRIFPYRLVKIDDED